MTTQDNTSTIDLSVVKSLDVKAQDKKLAKLSKDFAGNVAEAVEMSQVYAAYCIANGNSDLLRKLRLAIPDEYQPRLDKWVKDHIPFVHKKLTVYKMGKNGKPIKDEHGKKIVDRVEHVYKKDKKVEAEKGLTIFNADTFSTVPFPKYKPEPKDKDQSLAALAKTWLSRLERLAEVASEYKQGGEGEQGFAIFGEISDKTYAFHKRMTKLLATGSDLEAIDAVAPVDAATEQARARATVAQAELEQATGTEG